MTAFFALAAYALVAGALYLAFGNAGERVPAWLLVPVLAALALAIAGACRRPRQARLPPTGAEQRPRGVVRVALGLLVLLQIAGLFTLSPVLSLGPEPLPARPIAYLDLVLSHARDGQLAALLARPAIFPAGQLAIALLVISYFWRTMPGAGLRFPAALVIYVALGASVIHSSPRPFIDVWTTQERACKLLLQGENPYAADYPNPYHRPDWFAPDVVRGDRIAAYQYPPLSLLLSVPGFLLGDVRWATLAATAAAAFFLVGAGRRLGLPAGHPGELGAVALLCHPQAFLMIEMGWTEPYLALGLAVAAWAAAGRARADEPPVAPVRREAVGAALAFLVAVKQYGLLAVPGLWKAGRPGKRGLLVGALAAGVVTLPFALRDPEAFWRGVVTFHVHSPFRADHSLSVPAAVALATGYEMPAVLGFVAAALVAWFIVRRARPSLAQGLLGSAATVLAFIVFGKGGHPNYYWWASSILAAALVVAVAEDDFVVPGSGP